MNAMNYIQAAMMLQEHLEFMGLTIAERCALDIVLDHIFAGESPQLTVGDKVQCVRQSPPNFAPQLEVGSQYTVSEVSDEFGVRVNGFFYDAECFALVNKDVA